MNVRVPAPSAAPAPPVASALRPLRIAVYVHEFPTLSETFVLSQIAGLIDRGHDVTILANARGAQPRQHEEVTAYRLRERARYRDLPAGRWARLSAAVRLATRPGVDRRRLLASLNVFRFGREALSLRLFFWTARLAGERPFDVIHCHFGPMGRTAAFLRSIGALRGRLVTTFHGVDMSAYLRSAPRHYQHLFRHGDLFLPISEHWRRVLVGLGAPEGRVAVHRMGIDLSRFPFSARERRPGSLLRVLTVGRLVEKKGVDIALAAIAALAARGVAVHYDIAGDGPLRPRLEAQAVSLGLGRCVAFHGWQNQAGVARLMYACDLLLAPSRTDSTGDQEGIPVTLMEAMASGLPVVTTRHSGIPELVEHGVSGWLAEEGDVAGLVDGMARLERDPALAERFAAAARERIATEYDVERLNDRLETLFAALADGSRERAAPVA
ncbi:MAG TPA: glycosyltransferase [Alphaproteobacteria bacterium]|jgi:colanic acid/amylovoran biosynthesis glycosyltransferase